MNNDQHVLAEALKLFHDNERGLHIKNVFVDVEISLRANSAFDDNINLKVGKLFQQTWQDIWNISTLLDRIEWLRKEAIKNRIPENKWRDYTQVDIEHFHTEIRSAMDYVAQIVAIFSKCDGQLPQSFNRLHQRIAKFKNKINKEIFSLIQKTHWFSDIRHVRDSLVHYGGDTVVFCRPQDGILFQIYDSKQSNLINKKYMLFNENVVYFDKYAALYYAHILVFLDSLGGILINSLPNRNGIGGVRSYSAGFYIAKEWIGNLQTEILKLPPNESVNTGSWNSPAAG